MRMTAVAASPLLYISVNSVTFTLADFYYFFSQLAFLFVINPKHISPMSLYNSNFET